MLDGNSTGSSVSVVSCRQTDARSDDEFSVLNTVINELNLSESLVYRRRFPLQFSYITCFFSIFLLLTSFPSFLLLLDFLLEIVIPFSFICRVSSYHLSIQAMCVPLFFLLVPALSFIYTSSSFPTPAPTAFNVFSGSKYTCPICFHFS